MARLEEMTSTVWAVSRRPLLLLDVDGVLCPVRDNQQPKGYQAPSADFRSASHQHWETGETIELWVSPANAQRLVRLADPFEIVWATGWVHHANRVIGPLHGLSELPFVELSWSEEMRSLDGSWKLPAVARYVGDDRPCVWIDDDIRPDMEHWAANRRGRTLLIPVDHRVGLTERAVERALAFAHAEGRST